MSYLESSLLELSNDVKFVEILVKTTENTVNLHINSPTHVGHMTVSNLLWVYDRPRENTGVLPLLHTWYQHKSQHCCSLDNQQFRITALHYQLLEPRLNVVNENPFYFRKSFDHFVFLFTLQRILMSLSSFPSPIVISGISSPVKL